jgi:hypothetical protein
MYSSSLMPFLMSCSIFHSRPVVLSLHRGNSHVYRNWTYEQVERAANRDFRFACDLGHRTEFKRRMPVYCINPRHKQNSNSKDFHKNRPTERILHKRQRSCFWNIFPIISTKSRLLFFRQRRICHNKFRRFLCSLGKVVSGLNLVYQVIHGFHDERHICERHR